MKTALVTGGAGFLGGSVVRELVARGVKVRVLALPNEKLDNVAGLDVEVVRGNVTSKDDVERAVAGVDTVFHLATIYKDYMRDYGPIYEVAMHGTFHVLEASRRANVEKVIYTGSVVALGRPKAGTLADERTPYEAFDVDFHYSRAKWTSLLLARDFAAWGLDVRIVCPGVLFGPGDVAPTPSGKLICNVVLGKGGNVYTDGGCSYVDVRDVAHVHVLAAERGKAGETYVASAHNLDNKQLLEAIAHVLGKKSSYVKMPALLTRGVVTALESMAIKKGEEPLMTRPFFDYSVKPAYFDNQKSVKELGATYRPIEETIRDAIADFRKRGVLPAA